MRFEGHSGAIFGLTPSQVGMGQMWVQLHAMPTSWRWLATSCGLAGRAHHDPARPEARLVLLRRNVSTGALCPPPHSSLPADCWTHQFAALQHDEKLIKTLTTPPWAALAALNLQVDILNMIFQMQMSCSEPFIETDPPKSGRCRRPTLF